MVAKNRATAGKGQVKKLMLKRETLRDLAPRKKAGTVKGGAGTLIKYTTVSCAPGCSF